MIHHATNLARSDKRPASTSPEKIWTISATGNRQTVTVIATCRTVEDQRFITSVRNSFIMPIGQSKSKPDPLVLLFSCRALPRCNVSGHIIFRQQKSGLLTSRSDFDTYVEESGSTIWYHRKSLRMPYEVDDLDQPRRYSSIFGFADSPDGITGEGICSLWLPVF